ncbi:MAG TPA: PfkB family carbohydrate kinase [Acidimicrobiales bacterium]|nr:PfkB family carbohydrate kinase [Acidimicrobiales bacterium]
MSITRAVVLGDVMLDVVVQPTGRFAPTSDTPANILVARGGSGANVAIALRATGHHVDFVGASGRDAASLVFVDALERGRVNARLQFCDAPTGTVVAFIANDGQRAMLTDRGANVRLEDAFVVEQLREPFDHVHVSGYLLLRAATRGIGENVLALARSRGIPSSVDVCSVAPLMAITPGVFLHSARYASILFANEEEACVLTDSEDAGGALEVLARNYEEVVITRGESGAIAALGAQRFTEIALSAKVLDTTGAGDAATGTYLGARLSGEEPPVALRRAMAAAAQVVGGLGALG